MDPDSAPESSTLESLLHKGLFLLLLAGGLAWLLFGTLSTESSVQPDPALDNADSLWHPPDTNNLGDDESAYMIRYGRRLVTQTSVYLGPAGSVAALSNGMNCQNCHLDAGTRPYGNNFSAVASTYPKFRARSGSIETIEHRINDCIQRSLNGKPLDTSSLEMKALKSYILWVGHVVPKGETPKGAGLSGLPNLSRAASPSKGKSVYIQSCAVCHGKNGGGMENPGKKNWIYPPLWGPDSYNTAAGLFRLSRLANYVKSNMPFGATQAKPQLTDEQAWDVAAYINSQPRPEKIFPQDWPDVSKKPVDHPFGPFRDTFPAEQHKFGPFGPIEAAQRNN